MIDPADRIAILEHDVRVVQDALMQIMRSVTQLSMAMDSLAATVLTADPPPPKTPNLN